MADWVFSDSSRIAVGGTVALLGGGTVIAPVSVNTKGSWVQIASVPFDADVVIVNELRTVDLASDRYALFDIGKGTFGSEQVIFSNFPASGSENEIRAHHYRIPYAVCAGDVLCARVQSAAASFRASIGFHFESHGFAHFSSLGRVKTYGTSTATSRATVVPSGAANVKGSWVQITGSTSEDIGQIIIVAVDEESSGLGNDWYLADVGIGPAGGEKILIPDLAFNTLSGTSAVQPHMVGPIPVSIPAASRIAMRVQATVTDRDIGFAIIGISR